MVAHTGTQAFRPGTADEAPPLASRVGFGPRLGASLIDGIVLIVALVVLAKVLSFSTGLAAIVVCALLVGYEAHFEGGPSGQTPGKRVVGIRVVDARSAEPIGHGRAFARWLGKLASGFPFYLGYLWILWDADRQCWYDKIASTAVVFTRDYPVAS